MDKNYNDSQNESEVSIVNGEIAYPASKFSTFCFEWSETIVQAFIIVLVLLTFLFRGFTVDGESMMDTLLDKDKVAVIRWDYTPTNGDVVVIKHGQYFDKPLIKRVIATEGQSLKINFNTGSVIVDGKTLNETYIKERMWLRGDAVIPSIIPDGYCFVMGDNRNNSSDSRNKLIGLIPNEDIVGKAIFIFYPFNRIKLI